MKPVKCVVWDLDDTLWSGTLLEDDAVELKPGVVEVIRELDRRGILHSVASRNDSATALEKLRELGVEEYFLVPQIGWEAKHASVERVARELNVGLDALAFVDDQAYERDEVASCWPQVRCYAAADVARLPSLPEFTPRVVSAEAARRRELYRAEHRRARDETAFEGPREAFLATLGMVLTIRPAGAGDLDRAEELTVRTNQLNTTGRTYSRDELEALAASGDHLLLVAELTDRYGDYGTIGLALVRTGEEAWRLRLLLMSCRVMARGVGSLLLAHVMERASAAGVPLEADIVPNERNRMMLVTLRFAGFKPVSEHLLTWGPAEVPPPPAYVELRTPAAPSPSAG